MTPLLLVAILLLATRLPAATSCALGASALAVQGTPALAVPIAATWMAVHIGRARRAKREGVKTTRRDVATLAELTSIALTGGLGIRRSLELAGATVGGPMHDEVSALLARIRIDGSAVLATADGTAAPLYRTLGRAALSGAPLLEPIGRLTDQLHRDRAAAEEQRTRRLPILMLFPLTLLILPGFVLLTVAPALLDTFGRLQI